MIRFVTAQNTKPLTALVSRSDKRSASDKFLNQGVAWNGQSVVLGN